VSWFVSLDSNRQTLANERGLTPEYLAQPFTNKIERPSEFFHRLFQAQHAAVVIPHRSVLDFYTSMLHHSSMGHHDPCACGCKQTVFDRKKVGFTGIQEKSTAKDVSGSLNGGAGCLILLSLERDKNSLWLLTPSPKRFRGKISASLNCLRIWRIQWKQALERLSALGLSSGCL
jgi:hypothetical protein